MKECGKNGHVFAGKPCWKPVFSVCKILGMYGDNIFCEIDANCRNIHWDFSFVF